MSAPRESHPVEGDAELVARCLSGDAPAFDALVRLHQDLVFGVALRMLGDRAEAEEVAQDAFVRAYRGLRSFRGESKFSTWLVAIVMNLCRSRRKWWARRKPVVVRSLDEPIGDDDGPSQDVEDPSPGPAAEAMRREFHGQLAAGLAMLDEPGREVIVLRDVQGLSYEEIAQALRCEVGTVKSRLSRARWRLRAMLDGAI